MIKIKKLSNTKLNATVVNFMANSNVFFDVEEEYEDFKSKVEDLIMNDLFENPSAIQYIFGSAEHVDTVEMTSFGIEIGPNKGRGHFNLSIKIMHDVPHYSLSKLRDRFCTWLNDHFTQSKGWSVYTTLLPDGRHLNYDNKDERAKLKPKMDSDYVRLNE